ncbi:MAG TPA: glycosyltransferase [Candidatus Binataceae bacterium]|nr:glycosyltransferase [Candidatus Binataceae bacterium]
MFSETPSIASASPASRVALSLSIVVPTHGRLASLQKCLASILASDLPQRTELLVICNGSDPPSEEFVERLAVADPRIHLMRHERVSPAEARNVALSQVQGDIVYFLDDDVTVVPDLLSRALDTFASRPDIDVLGGPNLTPLDSSTFEKSVGYVLASRFGSARVCDRYRAVGTIRATDDRALILCNLAIRRHAIASRRPVFGDMVCNEENLLLGMLARENRTMLHDPGLIVYHARRGSAGEFARQTFRYGRGRWQNTAALPGSLSPVFLIPPLFLIYLVLLPLPIFRGHLMPLAAYGILLVAFSAFEALRARSLRALPQLLMLFPVCHLAYGAGLMWQFLLSTRPAEAVKARSEVPTGDA